MLPKSRRFSRSSGQGCGCYGAARRCHRQYPGAPGIGDKGSVELIQRFGSVENALEHASEVERKTYRESLQNNRNAVLVSKKLVTIDTDVAVDFEPETMRAQEPDPAAARALFTELEFTTLVQEFLNENIELGETDYREAENAAEVEAVIAAAKKPGKMLAIALESSVAEPAVMVEVEVADEPELEIRRGHAAGETIQGLATKHGFTGEWSGRRSARRFRQRGKKPAREKPRLGPIRDQSSRYSCWTWKRRESSGTRRIGSGRA